MSNMTIDGSRVTIGDVAARAGVSIATVSRVVNERYGVAASTITRVQDVIDELGYESSLVARSLRSQRTNVIGILVSDIEPFSAELLKGVARALHGSDYELVSTRGHARAKEGWERRYLSRLSGTLADGIDPGRTDRGRGRRHPSRRRRRPARRRIAPPDRRRPELRGCRRRHRAPASSSAIAGSASSPAAPISSRRAVARPAIAPRSSRRASRSIRNSCRWAGSPRKPRRRRPRALLSLADRPTAIFAANDLSAIQVIRTAHELGIGVPTTCRSSASTTSRNRRSPTRR